MCCLLVLTEINLLTRRTSNKENVIEGFEDYDHKTISHKEE